MNEDLAKANKRFVAELPPELVPQVLLNSANTFTKAALEMEHLDKQQRELLHLTSSYIYQRLIAHQGARAQEMAAAAFQAGDTEGRAAATRVFERAQAEQDKQHKRKVKQGKKARAKRKPTPDEKRAQEDRKNAFEFADKDAAVRNGTYGAIRAAFKRYAKLNHHNMPKEELKTYLATLERKWRERNTRKK